MSLNGKCKLCNWLLRKNHYVSLKYNPKDANYLLGFRTPPEFIQDRRVIKNTFNFHDLKFDFFGKYCLDIFDFEEKLDNQINRLWI